LFGTGEEVSNCFSGLEAEIAAVCLSVWGPFPSMEHHNFSFHSTRYRNYGVRSTQHNTVHTPQYPYRNSTLRTGMVGKTERGTLGCDLRWRCWGARGLGVEHRPTASHRQFFCGVGLAASREPMSTVARPETRIALATGRSGDLPPGTAGAVVLGFLGLFAHLCPAVHVPCWFGAVALSAPLFHRKKNTSNCDEFFLFACPHHTNMLDLRKDKYGMRRRFCHGATILGTGNSTLPLLALRCFPVSSMSHSTPEPWRSLRRTVVSLSLYKVSTRSLLCALSLPYLVI
jgi:hypothetical protein